MVRSSQVSPLDIQIKKRPADIFIPHLPNPTHYPFLSSVFYLHFSPPRWGEESGNGHEIPQPPAFMCLASLRTWEIYHSFMSLCLLWLTLIIKVYNHYRTKYIIAKAFFTPHPHWQGSRDIWFTSPFLSTQKKKQTNKPMSQFAWWAKPREIFLSHCLPPDLNLVPTLPTIQQYRELMICK